MAGSNRKQDDPSAQSVEVILLNVWVEALLSVMTPAQRLAVLRKATRVMRRVAESQNVRSIGDGNDRAMAGAKGVAAERFRRDVSDLMSRMK